MNYKIQYSKYEGIGGGYYINIRSQNINIPKIDVSNEENIFYKYVYKETMESSIDRIVDICSNYNNLINPYIDDIKENINKINNDALINFKKIIS